MKIQKINILMFLEGMVSISIQFLTLRQIMPYAGTSIVTTSIVISVFLIALAYGYQTGGQYKDDKIKKFKHNMMKSALFLGLGLSSVVVSLFFGYMNNYYNGLTVYFNVILYSFIIMAPMVYYTAQTVPLMVHLMKKGNSGEKTGAGISISTLGNVVGGLITTLVLMYFFGVSWAIIINSTILLMLYIYSECTLSSFIKALGAFSLIWIVNGFGNTVNHKFSTSYADYTVEEREVKGEKVKILYSNNSPASVIYESGENASYIKRIKGDFLSQDKKNVLVLGAGGFTLSENLSIKHNFTYVDIDSQIKEYVENNFLNKEISSNFIAQDARLFINENDEVWDVILVDVYSNNYSIPTHLMTQEFYSELKNRIKPGGVIFVNTIMDNSFKNPLSVGLNDTINYTLGSCFANKLSNRELTNVLYECYPQSERVIYTDQTTENSVHQALKP
jgi:predicted membrane-bound spermidine synthase